MVKLFLKVAELLYLLINNIWRRVPARSMSLPTLVIVYLFDGLDPRGCEVVPHNGFDVH